MRYIISDTRSQQTKRASNFFILSIKRSGIQVSVLHADLQYICKQQLMKNHLPLLTLFIALSLILFQACDEDFIIDDEMTRVLLVQFNAIDSMNVEVLRIGDLSIHSN